MKIKSFLVVIVLPLIICISRTSSGEGRESLLPSTGAGAAAIRGVITFRALCRWPSRSACQRTRLCQAASGAFLAKEVVVDSKGGLQNVIVFVADGLGDRTFDPPTEPAVIAQKGCLYQPHVLAVRANQPLQVVNDDSTAHNIHPTPANNREWNKAEPPGSS